MPDLFNKDNIDNYLKEVAKNFVKENGKHAEAEIVLVGGAAIVVGYGSRQSTHDIDALFHSNASIKSAINNVADNNSLPNGWLNSDFTNTASFSNKLREVSVHYKTFSHAVDVRVVKAEYLIAMKLCSAREYKHDYSDIVGILKYHKENGSEITKGKIYNAIEKLYGSIEYVPEDSLSIIEAIIDKGDYEKSYEKIVNIEEKNKEVINQSFEDKTSISEEDVKDIIKEKGENIIDSSDEWDGNCDWDEPL